MKTIFRSLTYASLLFLAASTVACSGFQGTVFERTASGGIGAPIPGVVIRFAAETGTNVSTVTSNAAGRYRISLPSGRYRVTAAHAGFEDYSSAPGFFVVSGSGVQTGNVFLRAPRATTVLVVRHADRADGADALTPAGTTRAGVLRDVARNAGVTAIFVTDFVRVRETARPLAEHLRIQPIVYGTPQEVAGTILSGHSGDVVLVVGHSNTVAAICESLLGQNLYTPDPDVEDFDNLFVVTRPVAKLSGQRFEPPVRSRDGAGRAEHEPLAAHDLSPDTEREGSGAALSTLGTARANALVDAMRKSGVSALFAPQGSLSAATLAPLSTALGQSVTSYDPANTAALVSQVQASHSGETVLVAGDNNTLRSLIRDLGAQPVPVIADEFDHLMVVTVLGAGDARVVNLQYGAPSP